jgi:pantothenate kinase type III
VKWVVATLDVGNSACKARRWELDARRKLTRVAAAQFATDAELCGALDREWSREPVDAVACSCVADHQTESALADWLRGRFGSAGFLRPSSGLDIACREPESVGSDRLYASRGAYEVTGSSVVVVDAGTAVTVDVLLVGVGAPRPLFAGGAIAPGPDLLAQALATGTARLPRVAVEPDAPALGRDTRGALASGILHGFRGAVRELAERVAGEAGIPDAAVVITGGASSLLGGASLFGTRTTMYEPDLVHLGLLCAVRDRVDGTVERTPRYLWTR